MNYVVLELNKTYGIVIGYSPTAEYRFAVWHVCNHIKPIYCNSLEVAVDEYKAAKQKV